MAIPPSEYRKPGKAACFRIDASEIAGRGYRFLVFSQLFENIHSHSMTRLPDGRDYTVVGVTGHIDHGKTALVGALTGIDTDRHPEEKRRGITIDLGFAALEEPDIVFAFVDAPGHQRYIANLLAGVSKVDIGLLVVAADQGIQAQTLEHTSILRSLGTPQLVVVISRIDLASPEQIEQLREELEVFLVDCGFKDFPIFCVSAVTGEGLDQLKAGLRAAARRLPQSLASEVSQPFRLPVDRVLDVPGRGLVLAGNIWSGHISVGDTVTLAGCDQPLRVRELEVHGHPVTESHAGLRTALNVTGNLERRPQRGDELIAPEAYQLTQHVVAQITAFPDAPVLKPQQRLLMHTATTSCQVEMHAVEPLRPGQPQTVLLTTDQPLIATWQQPVLMRLPHPIGSCAGGHVLASLPSALPRKRRQILQIAARLAAADRIEHLAGWIELLGPTRPDDLLFQQWVRDAVPDWRKLLVEAVKQSKLVQAGDYLVAPGVIESLEKRIVATIQRHSQRHEDGWMPVSTLCRQLEPVAPEEAVRLVVDRLVDQRRLARVNQLVSEISEPALLSSKQRARMERLVAQFENARKPPTVKELIALLEISEAQVNSLVRHAIQQGVLIDLGKGFLIGRAVFDQMCQELAEQFARTPQLSVAEIRDLWKVTRKHAIPLLEYCDRQGFTKRVGDLRSAGPNLFPAPVTDEQPQKE